MPELRLYVTNDASVAILLDAFWWIWIDKWGDSNHTSDKACHATPVVTTHHIMAQELIFARIADSYVALLLDVPVYVRDAFFKWYPHILAQTLLLWVVPL